MNTSCSLKEFCYVGGFELPLQFIICESPIQEKDNFICFQLSSLHIAIHYKLKRFYVFGPDGIEIGLFLGLPIDIKNETLIESNLHLIDNIESENVPLFLEKYGGSYIFIYSSKNEKKIFLDANGSMSLVYDPVEKKAGSTAAILLSNENYKEKFRRELFDKLDVSNIGWFPSGITAHKGIDRLLCNHYLDMNTWESVRFWPKEPIEYSDIPGDEISSISKETTSIISALCQKNNVKQSLTAGYETRFLLSCSKSLLERISFFTVLSTKIDVEVARKLGQSFKLNIEEIPVLKASISQQQEWLYRTGHTVGGTNLITHPSIQRFKSDTILSIGLGGEVGRGFFWKKNDDIHDSVTAKLLIGRFGLPIDELIVSRTEKWLANLPYGLDFFTILDLAYQELRMSAWAFAQSYAQDAICPHISPMITYNNYKSMFRIHPNQKRNNYILHRAVLDNWPELLKYPINRYGGFKDIFAFINKLSNPNRVLAKVRKLLAR